MYPGLRRWTVIIGILLLVLLGVHPSAAADNSSTPFSYVRLYAGKDGVSHFENVRVPFDIRDYAPPASPLGVSESMKADSVLFVHQASSWNGTWHTSPRRQFAILVSGTEEVTASDGEVRKFVPGDVVLLEDTSGKGHKAKVTSPAGAIVMMVPLRSDQIDDRPGR